MGKGKKDMKFKRIINASLILLAFNTTLPAIAQAASYDENKVEEGKNVIKENESLCIQGITYRSCDELLRLLDTGYYTDDSETRSSSVAVATGSYFIPGLVKSLSLQQVPSLLEGWLFMLAIGLTKQLSIILEAIRKINNPAIGINTLNLGRGVVVKRKS